MQKDVVLVTFNYRVSALGFVAFKDPSINVPGNAGLKDQRLVLKWVKENIDSFGGDSNDVTLFGHSAGGVSVHYHLLSPNSAGLFNRAIVMSGSALADFGVVPHLDIGERIAKRSGWNGEGGERGAYEHLKTVDPNTITKIAGEKLFTPEEKMAIGDFIYGPIIEPYETEDSICTKSPEELSKNAWSNDIEVIFWIASNETIMQHQLARHIARSGKISDNLSIKIKNANEESYNILRSAYNFNEFSAQNLQPYFDVSDLTL